jgi:hypothetical protein
MSNQQPQSTLQFRNLVHQRARQNEPLSNEEVAQITRESTELAGVDPGEFPPILSIYLSLALNRYLPPEKHPGTQTKRNGSNLQTTCYAKSQLVQ